MSDVESSAFFSEPVYKSTGKEAQSVPNYIPVSFSAKIADIPRSEHGCYEGLLSFFGWILGWLGVYVPCCCGLNSFTTVPQGFVGIISRFGKSIRVVDPGLYFVNFLTEQLHLVDVKIQLSDIPSQYVMTRDNVTFLIDSVVYWHITNPFVAKFCVSDVSEALIERTMTTLRDTIGAHELQQIIGNREAVAKEIKTIIEKISTSWGIAVESILIKDLRFSEDLQETLSTVAKQTRIGESKIISAKAEVEASRLMRESSDILNTPAAMQIRYLETLQSMARSGQAKVIFVPLADSNMKTLSLNLLPENIV